MSIKILHHLFPTSLLAIVCALACSSSDDDPVASGAGSSNAGSSNAGSSSGGNGGGSSGSTSNADSGATAGSSGDPNLTIGAFTIEMVAAVAASADTPETPAFTSLIGKVNSGATPQPVVWEETDRAGDCVLSVPRVPFCDPACSGGAVCVEDDTCSAYPTGLDAGTVSIGGVSTEDGADEISMTPLRPSNVYQPVGVTLSYPPFSDGAALSLSASGGDTAAFDIEGQGIAALEMITPEGVPFARDQAVVLEWVPGNAGTAARILVEVDISHHGGQTGQIDCDTSDSGSLEIDASLVTQLLDLNYAGFPELRVTRVATGSTVIDQGRVELRAVSSAVLPIEIEGLTSCMNVNSAEECPDGQVCLENRSCG